MKYVIWIELAEIWKSDVLKDLKWVSCKFFLISGLGKCHMWSKEIVWINLVSEFMGAFRVFMWRQILSNV